MRGLRAVWPLYLLGCAFSAEPVMWPVFQDAADLGWDEQQASLTNAGLDAGSTRSVQVVEPGLWQARLWQLRWSNQAQGALRPDQAPWAKGGQALFQAHVALARGPLFLEFAPQISYAEEGLERANDRVDIALRSTVGIHAGGHLWLVSNRPLQWGSGIFGGLVLSRSWNAPLYVSLLPERAWSLGHLGYEPLLCRYELLYALPDTPEDSDLLGSRLSLRWADWSLAYNRIQRVRGADGSVQSLTLGHQFAQRLESRLEVAQSNLSGESAEAGLLSLDWLDVSGDGTWRLAAELFRSAQNFYDPQGDGWAHKQWGLGHPDASGADSVRLLLQHRRSGILSGSSRLGLLGLWRQNHRDHVNESETWGGSLWLEHRTLSGTAWGGELGAQREEHQETALQLGLNLQFAW